MQIESDILEENVSLLFTNDKLYLLPSSLTTISTLKHPESEETDNNWQFFEYLACYLRWTEALQCNTNRRFESQRDNIMEIINNWNIWY